MGCAARKRTLGVRPGLRGTTPYPQRPWGASLWHLWCRPKGIAGDRPPGTDPEDRVLAWGSEAILYFLKTLCSEKKRRLST